MTPSLLDDPDRAAPLRGKRRAGATWLALVALLGNILLPAALSVFVVRELGFVLREPGRDIPGVGLCGHWPGNAPGKEKPGLLVQHCPLCTAPAAPPPRPPSIVVPEKLADEGQLQPLRTVSIAPIRHGRMQARAPPSVV
jgi:hypothetical protein